MLAVSTVFMGQFALFTHLCPFLETVTRVDVPTLSLVLLMISVAGFIGTTAIGTVLKGDFYRTLIDIPILMAAIAMMVAVIQLAIALGSSIGGLLLDAIVSVAAAFLTHMTARTPAPRAA